METVVASLLTNKSTLSEQVLTRLAQLNVKILRLAKNPAKYFRYRFNEVSSQSFLRVWLKSEGQFPIREVHQTFRSFGFDSAVQYYRSYIKPVSLVVFDFDATLVLEEGLDVLAAHSSNQSVEAFRSITEHAMSGKISFEESFVERIKRLKGLEKREVLLAAENLHINEGVEDTVKLLLSRGVELAIISGGIEPLVRPIANKLGISRVFCNSVTFKKERLSDQVEHPIITGESKREIFTRLATRSPFRYGSSVAVGDGANDVEMLSAADLGIAFKASDYLIERSNASIVNNPMTAIFNMIRLPGS